jgi:hypothetical protein
MLNKIITHRKSLCLCTTRVDQLLPRSDIVNSPFGSNAAFKRSKTAALNNNNKILQNKQQQTHTYNN